MNSTEVEDAEKAPSEGTNEENDEEFRKQEAEKQLQNRMRHLKKRMIRAEQEAQELQKRVDAIKAKINKPLEPPRICPQVQPVHPPPPLRRRRRANPDNWNEDRSLMDTGGAGDATVNARR